MSGVATPEGLENFFRTAGTDYGEYAGSVRRRLPTPPGVDAFVEVRLPAGERVLSVRTGEQRPDDDLVVTTGVSCGFRGGNVEVVGAADTDLRLYSVLLFDLFTQLRVRAGSPSGILVDRINAWRRMLGRGMWTRLTPEERMGLYGELLVLRDLLLPVLGKLAVRAWNGPSGSPRDFQWDGVGTEVKTVSVNAVRKCRINNEHQLDGTGLREVYLVHQSVRRGGVGESLVDMVDGLRSDVRLLSAFDEFEDRLLESGWVEAHRRWYEEERYALVDRGCYHVGGGFPRVVPEDLAPGVSGVSYMIDLSTCQPHLVDEEAVRSAVTRHVPPAKE
jgi:hypothetical protein